ncbi:MAG: SIMPL domain-containing protein [Gammaproteobacteria bacterium]|nr:SIMPL domain-containing protein [Gammaproteobacteria bacterium]MBV9698054.1 SIMPL domain-containing protein [Gammaproteobacteria bacterium]
MRLELLATLSLCAVSAAFAAEPPPPASISVGADAQVSAKPDRVQVDIGVTSHSERSQVAAVQNAHQVEAVLAAVRTAAGPSAQLQTIDYTIAPTYRYREGAPPVLTGYDASNVVQVTLDDLERTSAVLDAAAQAGANTVRGIQFLLKDPAPRRAEALRRAALKARAEADVLAEALGVRIVRVLRVEEQSGGEAVEPRMFKRAGAAVAYAGEPTPVESGSLDVTARVQLTLEVATR